MTGSIELSIHRPGKAPLTVTNPIPLLLQHHFGPMSLAGAMTCCVEDLTEQLAHLLAEEGQG